MSGKHTAVAAHAIGKAPALEKVAGTHDMDVWHTAGLQRWRPSGRTRADCSWAAA